MANGVLARLRHRDAGEIARLALKNAVHAVRSLTPTARADRQADRAFDRRWGTDTSTGVSARALGFDAAQIDQCRRYDPSREAMVRDPVAALQLHPAQWDFIDFGAGKGRAMMLAMEMGFASVTGVELSDRLCAIARANIARFADLSGTTTPAQVIAGDATMVAPAGRQILAYFYNPFGATIMTAVRGRLEAALRDGAARVTVIYANPEHAEVFADAPGWRAGVAMPGVATFLRDA